MRRDGLGVRDVGELFGSAWISGHASDVSDGRGYERKHDEGIVIGHIGHEHDAGGQWRGDGVSDGDGTWDGSGACGDHSDGARRADGMRGDGVGVGDVGVVHDGSARTARNSRYCGDGRRTGREHDGGVLDRRGEHELSISQQCGGDRLGVGDGAWIRAGTGGADGDGTSRADGMRGDGVGVGNIYLVPFGSERCFFTVVCVDFWTCRLQLFSCCVV